MFKLFIIGWVCFIHSLSCSAQSIDFYSGAQKIKTLPLSELKDLKDYDLYNPFRHYQKKYFGVDLFNLLTDVYGSKWKSGTTIKFVAIDGFIQMASIKKMLLESQKHQGVLSVGEDGKKGFSTFKKKGKDLDPGPYYIVWTGFDLKSKADYSHVLKWPFQLKSIIISGLK